MPSKDVTTYAMWALIFIGFIGALVAFWPHLKDMAEKRGVTK